MGGGGGGGGRRARVGTVGAGVKAVCERLAQPCHTLTPGSLQLGHFHFDFYLRWEQRVLLRRCEHH